MQQSISFSLIIIPLCQTKLENSSLNVISFSVRSSPGRFSPPRPGRSFSNLLMQGFHLLDRKDRFRSSLARLSPPRPGRSFSYLLWQGFDFIDREDRSKPSLARLSPPRPGVRSILQQSLELCPLAEDSVHRIWRSRRNAGFSLI